MPGHCVLAWYAAGTPVVQSKNKYKEETVFRMKFTTTAMFFLGTVAASVAGAASGSYDVRLPDPVSIGGTQFKAGDYKVEMQGDKAVFKSGKSVVEVPATLGNSDKKYTFTSVVSEDSKLLEIDLGGTSAKILLSPTAQAAVGSK